jgi:carotenoid isomerooxygenase
MNKLNLTAALAFQSLVRARSVKKWSTMPTFIDSLIHGDNPREKKINANFDGWMRTCENEILKPIQPVSVTGQVPDWVSGSLLRNGGGLMKIGPDEFKHIFDSLSLMHRYEINGGKVTYQRRFLQSQAFQKDMAAKRIVVSEFGTAGE